MTSASDLDRRLDAELGFYLGGDSLRVAGHFRQPHQLAEGAPRQRAGDEQAVWRLALRTDGTAVRRGFDPESMAVDPDQAGIGKRAQRRIGFQRAAMRRDATAA